MKINFVRLQNRDENDKRIIFIEMYFSYTIYRCSVPECENSTNTIYDRNWLHNALPGNLYNQGVFKPEQCIRFQVNPEHNYTNNNCPIEMFTNKQIPCDDWVFDLNEKTIVNEVGYVINKYSFSHQSLLTRLLNLKSF